MIQLLRTSSDHADFQQLVALLDRELAVLDGDEHAFYAQFNKTANLQHCVVAYVEGIPVGCGAFRPYDETTVEIKRMYVVPERRGRGIAGRVLEDLEQWANSLDFQRFILETGKRQPDAIALYTRAGYRPIDNFGQYAGVENSVCFEKYVATI